jgi:hypothetical protein
MNRLIVAAFRRWKRANMPRGMEVEVYHIAEFFHGLCAPGERHAPGTREMVLAALTEAGEFISKYDHVIFANIYLGRPQARRRGRSG